MRCQCEFAEHECGAKYRKRKCQNHRKAFPRVNVFTERSYQSLGLFNDHSNYLKEFAEGFGQIRKSNGRCLEVGCGVSPYVNLIQQTGLAYEGCDLSPFACQWMRKNHSVPVYHGKFEALRFSGLYEMILAAHVLEHVPNAAAALSKMSDLLLQNGLLYLLIPDDADLHNQDHHWFFTEKSAIRLMQSFGLTVESSVVKKIVARESFMYFVARKNN